MFSAYHIITNIDVDKYIQDEQPSGRSLRRSRRRISGRPQHGAAGPSRGHGNSGGSTTRGGNNEDPITETPNARSERTTEEGPATPPNSIDEAAEGGEADEEVGGKTQPDPCVNDTLDCSMGQRQPNVNRNKLSPWKVIAKHSGTRRQHYHIIYISTAKNWGHNSKLGKAIRSAEHKCTQIACVQCLLEYITTGDDRATLKQILTDRDKKVAMCVAHSLGIDPKQHASNTGSAEGGNHLFREQGTTRDAVHRRLDFGIAIPNEDVLEDANDYEQQLNQCEVQRHDSGGEQATIPKQAKLSVAARRGQLIRENQELVLHLCKNKAFDEGEATRLLCNTPEGIAIQFNRNFGERLKTALCIAKTLVFQESAEQRLERAKQYELQQDHLGDDATTITTGLYNLEQLLEENLINKTEFAINTRNHFYGKTKKKNNLFFKGPPSTGKTMIMESLVKMHFNYARLTGLTPNSAFNFASILHTNACFMDECKLTDNQFEQWKLLAARQPMSTDVKYKSRHDITNCILYTASNYPIDTYVTVGEARDAIETRTITYMFTCPTRHFKINPFIWEEFWTKHGATEEHQNIMITDDDFIDMIS